jgi:hypothetical protein
VWLPGPDFGSTGTSCCDMMEMMEGCEHQRDERRIVEAVHKLSKYQVRGPRDVCIGIAVGCEKDKKVRTEMVPTVPKRRG